MPFDQSHRGSAGPSGTPELADAAPVAEASPATFRDDGPLPPVATAASPGVTVSASDQAFGMHSVVASTSGTATGSQPAWQRDIAQRLAHHATPHDLGIFVARHVPEAERGDVWTYLEHERGTTFANTASAAATNAGGGPLSGTMLVSNNPEGLSSPGTIITADVRAGQLAAYIHHSNHTPSPLDLYLVVKPKGSAPVEATMSGASATTGDGKRAHGGAGAWASDPNVVVETANEVSADAHNRTNMAKLAHGPTPFHIGTLAGVGHGEPPLFDARYDLGLSGDAEVEIVAEKVSGSSAAQAAHETRPAVGNTKYEEGGTNGRAAGLYKGAKFRTDDTVAVSHLPHNVPLTGSKFSTAAPSPALEAGGAMEVQAPGPHVLAAASAELKHSVDAAAIYILEHVFRISPSWLREKKVWDGSRLTASGLSVDYEQLFDELKGALAADRDDAELTQTQAMIGNHSAIGARLDAASYGTMFELAFLLDNDTSTAANVGMSFLTDAGAARASGPGAVYRGAVVVDGVEHRINNDTASGHQSSADLGSVGALGPDETKYVKVQFQSPGQVSAGQELDIKKRG